jgi:hypothetical protein
VEALPGGMTALFGAGPGNVWLAKTYARSVRRPFGNIVGQDLVEAHLLPHNGDMTPFHEAGLAGLDMAMTGDGWAYHTMLDRSGRLAPGSLQHLGDSVLDITRALAASPLPSSDRSKERAVYCDVLGLTMAAYSTSTARALAVAALLLALVAIGWAVRRGLFSWRGVLGGLGWTLLATIGGLVAAMAGAALVSLGLGRSGWFSEPALAVLAYAPLAAAAAVGVHTASRRSGPAALAGALLFWSILLAVATAKGIGAGYLALFWVAGGALALVVTTRAPRMQLAATLACAPALLLTVELAVFFLSYFMPIAGLLGLGTIDVMVAALVGLPVVMIATVALPALQGTGGFARVALGLAAVGVAGLVMVAVHFPYTPARPKRVAVSHVADGDRGAIRIRFTDAVAMREVLAALPGATGQGLTRELPAAPPDMPAPAADVVAEDRAPDGTRRVTLRIHGTSPFVRLAVPREALLGWSLAESLAQTPPIEGRYVAQLYAVGLLPTYSSGPPGYTLTLTLRATPVEIELRGMDPNPPPGLEAVLKALPPWVTVSAAATRTTRLKI